MSSTESQPPSPYLFGSPLTRVKTRTSSISSLNDGDFSPADVLPSSPSSIHYPSYSLGAPLSRVETRSDSFDSFTTPSPVYQDSFVRLTSTQLTLSHFLLRPSISFPLSRIRSVKPLVSPADRVKLEGGGKPPLEMSVGTTNGGLGWTGIVWAKDSMRHGRGGQGLVVLDVDGWALRVGFSVEDEESFWAAWAALETRC